MWNGADDGSLLLLKDNFPSILLLIFLCCFTLHKQQVESLQGKSRGFVAFHLFPTSQILLLLSFLPIYLPLCIYDFFLYGHIYLFHFSGVQEWREICMFLSTILNQKFHICIRIIESIFLLKNMGIFIRLTFKY